MFLGLVIIWESILALILNLSASEIIFPFCKER
nr:MAG TPA: hypothetical protein [Caudoviricetes sp.]